MSDLETLMSIDPLSLTSENIDALIAFYRKQRADHQAGVKPKKVGTRASLDKIITRLAPKGSQETFKRRF